MQPEAHLRAATGGPCLHDVCIVIDYNATDGQSGQSSSPGPVREQHGRPLLETQCPGDLMRHAWALLSGPVRGSARCHPAVRLEWGVIRPAHQAPIGIPMPALTAIHTAALTAALVAAFMAALGRLMAALYSSH